MLLSLQASATVLDVSSPDKGERLRHEKSELLSKQNLRNFGFHSGSVTDGVYEIGVGVPTLFIKAGAQESCEPFHGLQDVLL